MTKKNVKPLTPGCSCSGFGGSGSNQIRAWTGAGLHPAVKTRKLMKPRTIGAAVVVVPGIAVVVSDVVVSGVVVSGVVVSGVVV